MKKIIVILAGLMLLYNVVAAEEEFVSLDFDKVDIRVVIKFVSELTGKNFLVDDKVSGTVTIVSPTKVSISEVYKVFDSILEMKGFAAVPAGNIVKIVPIREAQQRDIEVRVGKESSPLLRDDKIISQIIPFDYIEVGEAVNLLNPLKSPNTNIVVCRSSNSLIVTDTERNIQRLLTIVGEIDNELQKNEVIIMPVKFASAEKLRADIEPLIQSRIKPGRKVKILADERLNSLVVIASKQDGEILKKLVDELDKEVTPGQSEIHIYYVKNSKAEELAAVLSKIYSQTKGRVSAQAPETRDVPAIVADKNTNALIITASPSEYASLKNIIEKLDIKSKQVLVEALIAEVTLDTTKQLGIDWAEDVGDYRDKSVFAGVNSGLRVESLSGTLYGLGVGVIEGDDIAAIIHAYQANTNFNILSTPHILTNDNQEAEISIGKVVPLLKDSRVSEQETVVRTYEYKDIGIKLKIVPHINPDGYVRLEVQQEIQKLLETTLYEAPLMTKREAKTVVTVKDGKTVVIGGLIRDDKIEAVKKVPVLGDIPFLGWFFKRKTWTTEKTNLLIFITPRVVSSDEDLDEITIEKQKSAGKNPRDSGKFSAADK